MVTVLRAAAAALCLVAACSSTSDRGAAPAGDARTTASVAVIDRPYDRGGSLVAGPVAVDGRLVIVRGIELPEPDLVLVSDDRGRTWRPVVLPGAAATVELWEPIGLDGVVAVAAPGRFWTSDDGRAWRQGPAFGDTLGLRPRLFRVDDMLVASAFGDGRFQIIRSMDDGATWQPAEVGGVTPVAGSYAEMSNVGDTGERLVGYLNGDLVEPSDGVVWSGDGGATWHGGCPDEACRVPGVGIRWRNDAVSLDDGRTWVEPDLSQTSLNERGGKVTLSWAVDTGGRWVGLATTYEAGAGAYEALITSTDGRTWEDAVSSDCHQEHFSGPVRLDDDWYVGSGCDSSGEGVLLVSRDGGARFAPLSETRRSGRLERPIVIGERLVVPVTDHAVFAGVLEVTPR